MILAKTNNHFSSLLRGPIKGVLAIIGLLLFVQSNAQKHAEQICLNQLGFYTAAPKLALVTGAVGSASFYVTTTNLRDTVFRGTLEAPRKSKYSSLSTRTADFSNLEKEGSFMLVIPGLGHSYPFRIGNAVYRDVAVASLKSYYFQRSNQVLEPRYAGQWHRSAGHSDTEVIIHASAATPQRPAGTVLASPGGWYDAGDYNKYIVNSGVTMGTLLSAFEDFPSFYKTLQTNIPESSNAVPDILDEVVYNLRWMLTMQDPHDGGVYHKCTNAEFDALVMPGITRAPRYLVQKSTSATLNFAAVTAQAARVLKQYDKHFPRLADSCRKAALHAWAWAVDHPAVLYNQGEMNQKFEPKILTGAYGDKNLNDEWLWAAAELLCLTKEQRFHNVLAERMKDPVQLQSWSNVALMGYYSLIRQQKTLPAFAKNLAQRSADTVLHLADRFINRAAGNAFSTVMGQTERDYTWGGNSVAANQGLLLVQAYLLTKNERYLYGAFSNIDYLLGRNATGYSFITGYGAKTPMHPHHRQSEADGILAPVPGFVVGGPNIGMQDSCAYPAKEIETAYVDAVCSYASNEIAINWNAPVVYLFNAVEYLWQQREKQGVKGAVTAQAGSK